MGREAWWTGRVYLVLIFVFGVIGGGRMFGSRKMKLLVEGEGRQEDKPGSQSNDGLRE